MTTATPLATLTSWGRVNRRPARRAAPAFREHLPATLSAATDARVLGIGLGRSYGDSGLNSGGVVIDMTALDRVISFDPATGVLRGEAGLSLSDVLRICVPHGWFLPTTPGTRFVTLGGAVANDVHGKNHHGAGTIGCHVRRIGLHRSEARNDAGPVELSPTEHAGLFRATVGGLGLTGLIAWIELQLVRIPSAYLAAQTIPFVGYAEFAAIVRESAIFEHTVAWIDCTSGRDGLSTRGLFSRADWLTDGLLTPHDDTRQTSLPIELPGLAINPVSLRAFNTLYFHAGRLKGTGRKRVHYGPFFYPLDAIGNWNRAYGRAGFYQYQCVVPHTAAPDAIPAMLAEIASSGQGSCLAVLKTFGERTSPGILSFPMEGATLALDFSNRGPRTHLLFERLDAIVAEARGRLYPAKDGRMPPRMFHAGYPELDEFKRHLDPQFQSDFWRRMMS
jgi:FAD/FMN-containing dehydrogenase